MVLFCEYMRIVTLLIVEGIYWIEQPKEKMAHADNLICDYINKNFTRFFKKRVMLWTKKGIMIVYLKKRKITQPAELNYWIL